MASHASLPPSYTADCPVCSTKVIKVETSTETIWVLREEYAGVPGLPVNSLYGKEIPIHTFLRLSPCGHEVPEIELRKATDG